jgi:hypothetical protein
VLSLIQQQKDEDKTDEAVDVKKNIFLWNHNAIDERLLDRLGFLGRLKKAKHIVTRVN